MWDSEYCYHSFLRELMLIYNFKKVYTSSEWNSHNNLLKKTKILGCFSNRGIKSSNSYINKKNTSSRNLNKLSQTELKTISKNKYVKKIYPLTFNEEIVWEEAHESSEETVIEKSKHLIGDQTSNVINSKTGNTCKETQTDFPSLDNKFKSNEEIKIPQSNSQDTGDKNIKNASVEAIDKVRWTDNVIYVNGEKQQPSGSILIKPNPLPNNQDCHSQDREVATMNSKYSGCLCSSREKNENSFGENSALNESNDFYKDTKMNKFFVINKSQGKIKNFRMKPNSP